MSKEFFIINSGRVLYAPGHYELKEAQEIAQNEARRHPGRTYKVVRIIETYQVKKSELSK